MASVATFGANTAYVELTQYRYWLNEDLTVDTQYKIQPKYTMFLPFWMSIKKCCVSWNCSIKYNICTLSGMMKCICTRHETGKKTLSNVCFFPVSKAQTTKCYIYQQCTYTKKCIVYIMQIWSVYHHQPLRIADCINVWESTTMCDHGHTLHVIWWLQLLVYWLC